MTGRPGKEAVFLARGSYRQRRYRDLSRFAPVVGAVLFAVPLLWPRGTTPGVEPAATSGALIYIFTAWALLILSAFVLSRLIHYGDDEDEGEVPGPPPASPTAAAPGTPPPGNGLGGAG